MRAQTSDAAGMTIQYPNNGPFFWAWAFAAGNARAMTGCLTPLQTYITVNLPGRIRTIECDMDLLFFEE